MKKLLGLGCLVFVMTLLFNAPAYSGDKHKCTKKAANAATAFARGILYSECVSDDNLVFNTKEHNCAIAVADAKDESAAIHLYYSCIGD